MSTDDRARWDATWRERGGALAAPSAVLLAVEPLLPPAGAALDLGGGSGRHALWLARRGLAVTLVDVSPVAVGLAVGHAAAAGLPLDARVVDLEEAPPPARDGGYALVLAFHFLDRAVLAGVADLLAPGGVAVVVQPTVRNLERHPRPSRRFLLAEGEAAALVPGLEVVRLDEGWLEEGRHEARLVARRP
jgi:tellurite methyltransferase